MNFISATLAYTSYISFEDKLHIFTDPNFWNSGE